MRLMPLLVLIAACICQSTAAEPTATDRPSPLELSRITLVVRDMDAALAFYRDALALDIVYDRIIREPRDAASDAEAGRSLHLVVLETSDDRIGMIGVIEYLKPRKELPDAPSTPFGIGSTVLLFNAAELDSTFERAAAVPGVTVLDQVRDSDYPSADGGRLIQVRRGVLLDPDGYVVALSQESADQGQVNSSSPPPFASQANPLAPDYSRPESWAALPERPGASSVILPGASLPLENRQVDVFYVHPTTYRDMHRWNQDLSDEGTNAWTDVSVIARQASVFNACCNIYAPRYRQASLVSGSDPTLQGDGGKAYDLAYSDVLRAFDDFISRRNDSRPFILAGHSQGALMVYRLLRDRVDSSPLQNRLVVAYIVGLDLMQGDFGRTYSSLEICRTRTQTSCVLAWNAISPETDISAIKQRAGSRYAYRYSTQEGREAVCVNPLTFEIGQSEAPATASKGAVPGSPGEGSPRPLVEGRVAARCSEGYLVVDADPALDLASLPGGSMHYHEFGLFYADIRENLLERINTFEASTEK